MRDLNRILFLDIETIPKPDGKADQKMMKLFDKKFGEKAKKDESHINEYFDYNGGIYAEFGQICCISLGILKDGVFIVKSIAGEDEFKILIEFTQSFAKSKADVLCAHNGHEFDFPYLYRRMMIDGITPLSILDSFGKKPWEIADKLLDTMKIWSGVQYNHRVSLDLLCYILGIPSPKDEVTGDMIQFLYQAKDFEAIKKYCAGDVIALAKVFAKLMGSQEKFENIQIY